LLAPTPLEIFGQALNKPNMKSKVDLIFSGELKFYELSKAELIQSKKFILPHADIREVVFEKGNAIIQSFSNFLVFVEHYEIKIEQATIIDISVKEAGLFLCLTVSGNSIFEDGKGKRISESRGNSCSLTYLKAGFYRKIFIPGLHKIVLLTYRDEFFLKRAEFVPEFTPLVKAFLLKKFQR